MQRAHRGVDVDLVQEASVPELFDGIRRVVRFEFGSALGETGGEVGGVAEGIPHLLVGRIGYAGCEEIKHARVLRVEEELVRVKRRPDLAEDVVTGALVDMFRVFAFETFEESLPQEYWSVRSDEEKRATYQAVVRLGLDVIL
jgi:hypothetical protein